MATVAVKTSEGKCGVEEDRAFLNGLILSQAGGYERLDKVVALRRAAALRRLSSLLKLRAAFQEGVGGGGQREEDQEGVEEHRLFDWLRRERFSYSHELDHGEQSETVEWAFQSKWPGAPPLGASSYPLGPSRHRQRGGSGIDSTKWKGNW